MIKSKLPVIQTNYKYPHVPLSSLPKAPDTTLYASIFSCDNVGKRKETNF